MFSDPNVSGESRSITASWGDYDGDGYLDLYIAQHEEPDGFPASATEQDFLFRNNSGASFTDVSQLMRLDTIAGWSFIGGWENPDGLGHGDEPRW